MIEASTETNPMNNQTLLTAGDELFDGGNYLQAFNLYQEAANAGCAHSMLRLASMYTCGEGVACNYDKAIEWEHKAVAAGEPIALLNLGISYRIKGDIKSAKYWLEKAVAAGDGSGALNLAKLYMVSDKENTKITELLKFTINADNSCDSDIEEAQHLLLDI